MTTANEKQVGGSHYRSKYQHWDWVIDMQMHYLLGCATKYVARWRKKHGLEDLKKAEHYVEKAREAGIKGSSLFPAATTELLRRFVQANDLTDTEGHALHDIIFGNYDAALAYIAVLKDEAPKTKEHDCC